MIEKSAIMSQTNARIEHDLLGDLAVPADAYYGVQTARALVNFHISGVELRLYPDLIKASRWSKWPPLEPTPIAEHSTARCWPESKRRARS